LPLPSRSCARVKSVLRVDKKFRSHGPEDQRKQYHKRPAVEAVFSFLKTQHSLAMNKVRGVRNVAVYALYSIFSLILTREVAENLGRQDKTVSPTYFNT
jgi:transposase